MKRVSNGSRVVITGMGAVMPVGLSVARMVAYWSRSGKPDELGQCENERSPFQVAPTCLLC